jgi:hypothetical protein
VFRLSDVGNHFQPFAFIIMGAIDARAIHAATQQFAYEYRVGRCFPWQGHHRSYGSARMRYPEKPIRVLLKKPATARHVALDTCGFAYVTGKVEHSPQGVNYSVKCTQDMAFASA